MTNDQLHEAQSAEYMTAKRVTRAPAARVSDAKRKALSK
jgi:hypothetical protein